MHACFLHTSEEAHNERVIFNKGNELAMTSSTRSVATPALTEKREAASASAGRRVRLNPHERERQIVQGAVSFFAEVGFSGQTRELAKRLGITQGLLYRYFPSKEALMDRVYQEVFEARWNPQWDEWLADGEQPLRERLIHFYTDYARVIHTYEWVRIFLLSGIAGLDINQRYIRLVRKRIYPRVIRLLRREFGLAAPADGSLSRQEDNLMLNLHGMVFFLGIRKWVYRVELQATTEQLITQQIDLLLYGAREILKGAQDPEDEPNEGA
jgi:AcrR family transcriptional regulator